VERAKRMQEDQNDK